MAMRYETERLQREGARQWERYSKCKQCGEIMEYRQKPICTVMKEPVGGFLIYAGVCLVFWTLVSWIGTITAYWILGFGALGVLIGFIAVPLFGVNGAILIRLGRIMRDVPTEIWHCKNCGNKIELP